MSRLAGFVCVAIGICTTAIGQTVTVYGTAGGQSGPAYPGGSIAVGDTVRIDDGGSVTGDVSNSGTLQFNQTSGSIALTGTYTGSPTATLVLTNGGTVGLLQSTTTTIIDGAVDVRAGRLSTGTSALFIAASGTGSLSISGNGSVATTFAQFASGSSSMALFTISGGTFTNTARSPAPFSFASGTASSGTFTMTGGTAALGGGSGGGFAYGPHSNATMLLSGGTMSWDWVEPAKGNDSTATITISGSARLNASQYIRMSLGSNSLTTMTVSGGVVNAFTLRMGSGANSVSTLTVTGGSVGFNGTGATINANLIGAAAGSSGTITFTGGTTTFAGPTNVGGLGTVNSGGTSRGLFKVEGGVITTNTAASGIFSSVLENHFILGRYAPTTGEMVMTGGTFTAQRDFYVGGSGTGTLTLSGSGGRMQVGRLFISSTVVSQMNNTGGAGSVTVSSGTLLVTGSGNAANLFVGTNATGTGSLTIKDSGVVIVSGSLSRGAVGAVNLQAGGTLQIGTGSTGGVLLGGTGSLVNDGTLIFNRGADVPYSGVISGSGSVIKRVGVSWLTFSGSNTYAGLTSVEAGRLRISGSGSLGTGGLSLAAGTTFDLAGLTSGTYALPATGDLLGSGTVTGSGKTLAVLGTFLPGSSATGTFTADSGLTLDLSAAAGSTFQLTDPTFAAGTYDLVNGDGSLILGGPLTLAFTNGPYANGTDVLQLFANTGLLSGTFTSVTATGLAPSQSAIFNASTGFISIVAVPEPSAIALVGIGTGLAGLMRCRRRRVPKTGGRSDQRRGIFQRVRGEKPGRYGLAMAAVPVV
jgi:autotransporter-associated beta strand protein/T5SS/PEP-CTERM-associated repeat protein